MNERITVELDAEVLAAARDAGLDLSELLTRAVSRYLQLQPAEREKAARRWYDENKQTVDAYNKMVKKHGLFSDGYRTF